MNEFYATQRSAAAVVNFKGRRSTAVVLSSIRSRCDSENNCSYFLSLSLNHFDAPQAISSFRRIARAERPSTVTFSCGRYHLRNISCNITRAPTGRITSGANEGLQRTSRGALLRYQRRFFCGARFEERERNYEFEFRAQRPQLRTVSPHSRLNYTSKDSLKRFFVW